MNLNNLEEVISRFSIEKCREILEIAEQRDVRTISKGQLFVHEEIVKIIKERLMSESSGS
jgi:hypothetical protein